MTKVRFVFMNEPKEPTMSERLAEVRLAMEERKLAKARAEDIVLKSMSLAERTEYLGLKEIQAGKRTE